MPWDLLIWAAPVTLAAGLMRGFAGFGSGMLMAPFFIQLFGPVDTVVLIVGLEIVVTAQLLPSVYRHIDWSLVLPMGGVAALAMPVGTWLLLTLDTQIVSNCVGVIIIGFCLALTTGWRYRGPKPVYAPVYIRGRDRNRHLLGNKTILRCRSHLHLVWFYRYVCASISYGINTDGLFSQLLRPQRRRTVFWGVCECTLELWKIY